MYTYDVSVLMRIIYSENMFNPDLIAEWIQLKFLDQEATKIVVYFPFQ